MHLMQEMRDVVREMSDVVREIGEVAKTVVGSLRRAYLGVLGRKPSKEKKRPEKEILEEELLSDAEDVEGIRNSLEEVLSEVEETEEATVVEETPEGEQETPPHYEEMVEILRKTPEGLKLVEIGEELDVNWQGLIKTANQLIEEGRVRKGDERTYYWDE